MQATNGTLHKLPDRREREFLRAWTRHEAALKCRGVGIAGSETPVDGASIWLAEIDLGPLTAGTVAVAGTAGEVRCWQWHLPK